MICAKCKKKMKCQDTFSPDNFQYTYRRLFCEDCKKYVYTEESVISEKLGRKWFANKRKLYKTT